MGTFMKGAPLSKADIAADGTPFILYGELYTTYSEVAYEIQRKTDKEVEPQFYSRVGDVIMPTSGETPEDIATATCVMTPNVILAGDLLIYRTTAVDGRIISYAIKNKVDKKIASVAQGKSVVHIKAEELGKVVINYPSNAEQEKIITMLALLEKKLVLQKRIIETLKKYKRGVSRAIFTQEIRLLPNGGNWRQTTVGNICDIVMGQSPDSDSYNTDGVGVPLVQGNADMCNGITSPKRFSNKPTKICEDGSIILSVRAPVGAVGRADRQICIGRGVCAINSDNNDYLYHFLAANESYWKHIEQGGTFTAISGDDIASMPILYPSTEERKKISQFLNLIDSKVRAAETLEIALLTLKNSLLKNLFI